MTVKELIEKLQQYPGDTQVVIYYYDGDYAEVEDIESVELSDKPTAVRLRF